MMIQARSQRDRRHRGRKDRLIREMVHDPYRMRRKLPEDTVCPSCNAVFLKGRWQWMTPVSETAATSRCPACRRIEDRAPAGYLRLAKGPFFLRHRKEILNLLHNVAAKEEARHPLKRLIDIAENDDHLEITFTDPRLARAAGEAIVRAYQGQLDFSYPDEEHLLRVDWSR